MISLLLVLKYQAQKTEKEFQFPAKIISQTETDTYTDIITVAGTIYPLRVVLRDL